MDALVRRYESLDLLDCRRGRGRSMKWLKEVIKYDLKVIRLTTDIAHDRSLWRSRIKVVEHM